MATPEQVAGVRENTAESEADHFEDDYIEALVDSQGVNGASATIWRKKAASYAELVDVEEAGSSHKFSQLHKNALEMVARFEELPDDGVILDTGGRVKIRSIQRELRE